LDFAPTGAPLSLVDARQPDLARYPKFRDALAAAQGAELEPGDAVYIPPLWWHHVESLATLNVLVNYWWHALARGVRALCIWTTAGGDRPHPCIPSRPAGYAHA
jgi:hypothetical protein